MRNKGKIALGIVLIIIAIAIAFMVVSRPAQADQSLSQTFTLPSSSSVTHTANTYIILWDIKTGNLVADAGTIAAGNTWTGGDIATAVHAQNGLVWTATIPALDDQVEYGMAIFDAASPAKTDVPTMGPFLYDARINKAYTDTSPVQRANVLTRSRN